MTITVEVCDTETTVLIDVRAKYLDGQEVTLQSFLLGQTKAANKAKDAFDIVAEKMTVTKDNFGVLFQVGLGTSERFTANDNQRLADHIRKKILSMAKTLA